MEAADFKMNARSMAGASGMSAVTIHKTEGTITITNTENAVAKGNTRTINKNDPRVKRAEA